jgi:hypothetical protein
VREAGCGVEQGADDTCEGDTSGVASLWISTAAERARWRLRGQLASSPLTCVPPTSWMVGGCVGRSGGRCCSGGDAGATSLRGPLGLADREDVADHDADGEQSRRGVDARGAGACSATVSELDTCPLLLRSIRADALSVMALVLLVVYVGEGTEERRCGCVTFISLPLRDDGCDDVQLRASSSLTSSSAASTKVAEKDEDEDDDDGGSTQSIVVALCVSKRECTNADVVSVHPSGVTVAERQE